MATFKLPESELTDMRQFYEDELDKTVKRLQHIKSVLEQLGGNAPSIDIKIVTKGIGKISAKQLGSKSKSQTKSTAKGLKRGRKSIWDKLILNRLETLNRPLTYDELTADVLAFSKLPESKRLKTKQAVLNVTFRLRTRDKKIATFSMGSREKFIALNSWFSKPGVIKPEYASRIKTTTSANKETPVKKTAPKPKRAVKSKAVAKKATSATKAPLTKKAPAKRVVKKPTAQKAASKKTAVKKPIAKKIAIKKVVAKKVMAKKAKPVAKTPVAPKASK
jgi:hypothetical protein